MSPKRHNIFISSTSLDLQPYRLQVERVILQMRQYPIGMENFVPTRLNAVQLCYNELQDADIFIGIYASYYGYQPATDIHYARADGTVVHCPGDKSITQLEYEWAVERGIPMLLYVLDRKAEDGSILDWDAKYIDTGLNAERLQAFMSEIRRRHVLDTFRLPADLGMQVAVALHEHIPSIDAAMNTFTPPPPPPKPAEPAPYVVEAPAAYSGSPTIHRAVETAPGMPLIASATRALWIGQVWRKYCAVYLEKHQEAGRIDREFFDLLGIVNPINVQVELDRNRQRYPLTEAILGTGKGGYRRLIVLGEPGSGKTTLLRYAAMLQSKQGTRAGLRQTLIPLFVDLRFYTGGDFMAFLQSKLAAFGLPLAIATLNEMLSRGRFTLYLDSLNEMPRYCYEANILEINGFIGDYPRNQYVISCRKDEYRSEFSGVHAFIQPLENEHIERYIRGYISDKAQAAELYERLQSERLVDAVRNPFALFIVIQTGITPKSKTSLFQALVHLLIDRDMSKGSMARSYRLLEEAPLVDLLSHLAFFLSMHLRSQVAAKTACLGYLHQHFTFSAEDAMSQAADALLLRFEDRQRLNLGFWHQSLLSYFFASYIAKHWKIFSDEQMTLLLTASEFWETITMIGAALPDKEEQRQLAERFTAIRGDVVGAMLAATLSSEDILTASARTHRDHVYGEINWQIATFMTIDSDRLDDEHWEQYQRQTQELAAVVRLSGDAKLIELIAKWMPEESAIRILGGVRSEASIGILIQHYLATRETDPVGEMYRYRVKAFPDRDR